MRLVFTSDPNFPPLVPCITNWMEGGEEAAAATRQFGSCPALRDKINCDACGNGRRYWRRRRTLHFCTDFPLLVKTVAGQEKKEASYRPFFLFYLSSVLFMQSARRRRQHWVSKEQCHWFLGIPSIRLSMYVALYSIDRGRGREGRESWTAYRTSPTHYKW